MKFRICKVLETRSKQDEERMDQLTAKLKEARIIAEDADNKSDEISRKLAFVEDELEIAEDRVKSSEAYVTFFIKTKLIDKLISRNIIVKIDYFASEKLPNVKTNFSS